MITLTWWQLAIMLAVYALIYEHGINPLAKKMYHSWKNKVLKNRRRKINTRKYW